MPFLHVGQKMISVFDILENIIEKRRMIIIYNFPFPTMFFNA